MAINTFGVIGAGQMGNGIAQVAATAGLNVIMSDIKIEFAEKGLANITKILGKNVDKGKISAEDRDAILGRIKITADLKDMADADFVVEAATENETLKFKIFKDLDDICGPDVILSTNTSSIPIGRIAAQTSRPDNWDSLAFSGARSSPPPSSTSSSSSSRPCSLTRIGKACSSCLRWRGCSSPRTSTTPRCTTPTGWSTTRAARRRRCAG